MKIAKVIPVFKSGDKSQFNNYRPIALLPQMLKMYKKLFERRLDASQYGFQSGRSTAMAIDDLVVSC